MAMSTHKGRECADVTEHLVITEKQLVWERVTSQGATDQRAVMKILQHRDKGFLLENIAGEPVEASYLLQKEKLTLCVSSSCQNFVRADATGKLESSYSKESCQVRSKPGS